MTTIRIEATSSVDPWVRYHGLAIDEELKPGFWTAQPEKIIGAQSQPFSYTTTVSLSPGGHTITYGNSAPSGYEWDVKIYVDNQLIATGQVSRDKYLRASFTITPPPAPTTPKAKIVSYSFPSSPQSAGTTLKISFTIQNIGVDGEIYWRLYETGTKEEFQKWVGTMASREQKSFDVYITMPQRNISYLYLQAGHVENGMFYQDDYISEQILLSTTPTPAAIPWTVYAIIGGIILVAIIVAIMRR